MKPNIKAITDQIISKINSVCIFSSKIKSLLPIFTSIRNLNNQFFKDKKYGPNDLSIFYDSLEDFDTFLTDFIQQDPDSFFDKYKKISEITSAIDNCMNNIISRVENIHKVAFRLPTKNYIDDIKQFDELTKSKNKQGPELQLEIKKFYDDSVSEFNILMKKYKIPNLDRESYTKKQNLNENQTEQVENEPFYICQGETKDKQQANITVLREKDKFKSLSPIYAELNQPFLEELIGASISSTTIEILTKVKGEPLTNISLEKADFSLTVFAFKIAQAMSYLHSKNIIFRDFDFSHIFVDQIDPQNPLKANPIIANFANSIKFTENSFLGTPNFTPSSAFCAPELTSNYYYDEKVDVFAFGELLYQFLTFSKPYANENYETIRKKIIDNKRPHIPNDKYPKNIISLIENCLKQDFRDRFSFDQIIDFMSNSECPVIFPSDKDRIDDIIEFYSQNSISNEKVRNISNLFETVIKKSSEIRQFKCTFSRVRMSFVDYKNQIRNPNFGEKEGKDLEALKKPVDSLIEIMNTVEDINKLHECYKDNIQEVENIPNCITAIMKQIRELINKVYGNKNVVDEFKIGEDEEKMDYCDILYLFLRCYGEINEFSGNIPSLTKKIEIILSQYNSKRVDPSDFYYFKENIDEGGNSTVYKGVQMSTGKIVAVKKLRLESTLVLDNLIYLQREIGNLVRLKSMFSESRKYIPDFIGYSLIKDASSQLNGVLMILEYKDESLFDLIFRGKHKDEKPFDSVQKTKVAYRIAKAIKYFHSQRIFHRDLKSANIMIDGDVPLLIDFGYSRSEIKDANYTFNIGTSNYMAPEIMNKDLNCELSYNRKIDIFSFGMILWEIYAGEIPFHQYFVAQCIVKKELKQQESKIAEDMNKFLQGNQNKDKIIKIVTRNIHSFLEAFVNCDEAFEELKKIYDSNAKLGTFVKKMRKTYFPIQLFENIDNDVREEVDESVRSQINDYVLSFKKTFFKTVRLTVNRVNDSNRLNLYIRDLISENVRPPFKKDISDSLRQLIEDCWKQEPRERPRISTVMIRMKTQKISFLPGKAVNDEEEVSMEEEEAIIDFYDDEEEVSMEEEEEKNEKQK